MEYKVIGGSSRPESLERAINNLAAEGWRGARAPLKLNASAWGMPGGAAGEDLGYRIQVTREGLKTGRVGGAEASRL
jgi:hypothetical protein